MNHVTYILLCADDTLYTGYTNNLEKRIETHQSGKGAKYTRGRLPINLVYHEVFEAESDARKREYAIKRLSRTEKLELIQKFPH